MKRMFRLIEEDDGALKADCFSYQGTALSSHETVDVGKLPGWLVTEFLGPVAAPVMTTPEPDHAEEAAADPVTKQQSESAPAKPKRRKK